MTEPTQPTEPEAVPTARQRAYRSVRDLIGFDPLEQVQLIAHMLRWVALGSLVGVLAGLASTVFLMSLDWATETFDEQGWLLYLLPLAGVAIGLAYHYGGGRSVEGNNLIIDEIHAPSDWVPRRMAPMVLVGTVVTHLFGGSAGREGTAIQMSGSLADTASRIMRLDAYDRRIMLITAIAGGFGSVFGVPLAGAVFALEVQAVGRVQYEALVPCLAASVVGDLVVAGLGVEHTPTPDLGDLGLSGSLLVRVAVAGLAFGLASVAFSELTHGLKRAFAQLLPWAPGRPFVGGILVIGLTLAAGTRAYNGLSLGLAEASLAGAEVPTWAFALKILFTAVTLGAGFVGGEVTPLFVVGATLGATLAGVLDVPVPLMAALGFVAVFAGAANTPLACTLMGVELFGAGAVPYLATACVVSYVFSSHRGIYGTQRIGTPKLPRWVRHQTLGEASAARRRWLP
jgi:H+/Cl- antiporter ClcA